MLGCCFNLLVSSLLLLLLLLLTVVICSSLFTAADFQQWRGAFYARLLAHMKRASDSIGEQVVLSICSHCKV
jgi:hypothetical protein